MNTPIHALKNTAFSLLAALLLTTTALPIREARADLGVIIAVTLGISSVIDPFFVSHISESTTEYIDNGGLFGQLAHIETDAVNYLADAGSEPSPLLQSAFADIRERASASNENIISEELTDEALARRIVQILTETRANQS